MMTGKRCDDRSNPPRVKTDPLQGSCDKTWRVINVEDWAEIRRLYLAEQMPIKAIARKLGLSRNTVRTAVRSVQPPKYVRAAKGSIVDVVEPQVRQLLKEFPEMPATVIAERIGWTRSLTVLEGAGA
jgi:transposase